MKKWIMILFSLLAIAVLATSCEVEPDDENATVRFSISNDRARTISSDTKSVNIAKYKFTLQRGTTSGTSTDYSTITKSYEKTFEKVDSGTYSINGILPGGYTIYCEALSSDGTVIGKSNTVKTFLKRGSSTFSLTISALSGSQKAVITYKWDKSSFVTAPDFVFSVTNESGGAVTLNSSNYTLSKSDGEAVVTVTMPAGSYLFTASLVDSSANNVSYACLSDVVRFTNSSTQITSTQDFAGFGSVQSKATITSTIYDPLVATMNTTILSDGLDATLTFSNLPSGVTEADIDVDWLIDGVKWFDQKGDKKMSIGGMDSGTYRITAVMSSSVYKGSMGSVSEFVTIK